MQLPTIDRQPGARLSGVDLASANGARVIPVAPVNPVASISPPGVVSAISDGARLARGNAAYTSVSDPAQPGSEAATGSKDWTIKRPQVDKVEAPPPEPLYKLLVEFIQSMWRASGSAVEIAQLQNQNLQRNQYDPKVAAATLATENLTYSPSKIKKVEKL